MEIRTPEQIREHYELEIQLASKLRSATKEQRKSLYKEVYDELYDKIPHIPHLSGGENSQRSTEIGDQTIFLRRFLGSNITFLEIGPGDCRLATEVAKLVRKVYLVDVSREIADHVDLPGNSGFIISDGLSVPVPTGSINVVYMDQVIEHLHPEDALEQLKDVYRVLIPGGV